jgi:hypothetical protein
MPSQRLVQCGQVSGTPNRSGFVCRWTAIINGVPSATLGPHVQRRCIMSLLYSKIKRRVYLTKSCLKSDDVPNFPLPKIGSLVQSVGTISIRKIAASGSRQHPPSSLHLLHAVQVLYIERTKAMSSSFNAAGRVGDSSLPRDSYRRSCVDGHRVFLERLGDWQRRQQTCA